MSVLYEFLDVCYAQCKQAERIAVMSGSARMLFEYSALRLAKIGCAGKKDPEKWQGLFDKILEDTKRIYPDHQLMGETVRLKWNFHPALAWLAARTGDKDLVAALDQAAGEICNDFHRNEDGLFDNPVYPGALSTEILAMTVPILAWAGKCTGKSSYTDEAVFQMKGFMEKLCDKETLLWHPGYLPGPSDKTMWTWWQGSALRSNAAMKEVGLFAGYWGRGTGYALFALSELVFELDEEHKDKVFLLRKREEMFERLLACQDEQGMFHQVLNDSGSYEETGATGWILYAFGRAIKRGTVDRARFIPPYVKGLAGISRYLAWDGSILNGSAAQMCPGGRGGAVDYAMLAPLHNEPSVFAPVILALQQAGQIRNHTDLIRDWTQIPESSEGGAE